MRHKGTFNNNRKTEGGLLLGLELLYIDFRRSPFSRLVTNSKTRALLKKK